ncbi:MAG TPA: hypothetical protein VG077_10170 [Verrucomicrobiae bacterium]|nr:hypothetical protein [Verrucomicrobiae bacterium]
MEPEREIEKLLRAYAEKRRAAAGDPLKPHPATRRLLQDEVSRRAPKPETEEASLSLWQLFRQRWAFLLGFALMIFLGAMLVLPPLSSAKRKAQSVSAMNNLEQIGAAAQMAAEENKGKLPVSLEALTNGFVPEQVLTDPVSGKPFVYLAGGQNLDELPSNAVLAYSPVDKDGRAVLLADGRVEYADHARFRELTNQKSFQLAQADKVAREKAVNFAFNGPAAAAATPPPATVAPAATPPAAPTVGGEPAKQTSEFSATQSFVQTGVAAKLQNLYRNVAASAQAAPVLQSFRVLQNGDVVSVVDRDGSVYQGSVQMAVAEREAPPPLGSASRAVAPSPDQAKTMPPPGNQQQAVQNYFFRVTGMNRTLKQNVVFTGNVEALPGAITNTQPTLGAIGGGVGGGGGGDGGVAQNNRQISANQVQWQLSNSRVVGTAVINHTNQIQINAVPVAP